MPCPRLLAPLIWICVAGVAGIHDAAAQEAEQARFVQNAIARHYVPRVAAFAAAADELAGGVEALCKAPAAETLRGARAKWIAAMLAWESANGVAFGPLLTRRSIYRIDFWPVRRNLITQALAAPPANVAGLELIGGPAKGIPAVEWLLWEQPAVATPFPTAPDSVALLRDPARCVYARVLAAGVAEEARLLNADFVAFNTPASARAQDKGEDPFPLLLNQVLGAIEQLMYKKMEIPASGNPSGFARTLSGQTAAAWNAQWSSIRNLLLGEEGLVAYLRARGFDGLAGRLQSAAERLTATLAATQQGSPSSARLAAKDLAAVRVLLRADVSAALKIPIQFSEADGD